MNTDKRRELEQRRRQSQSRRAAQAFVQSDLEPFLEILDLLRSFQVQFEIVQLLRLQDDWVDIISETIQQSAYVSYGFDISHTRDQGVSDILELLFDRFPSLNAFRYVPDLTRYADYSALPPGDVVREGLQTIVKQLDLQDQDVYLYYLRYAVVVKVSLHGLTLYDHADLFNLWHGDALIFPADLTWLAAFSLEEEWYGGFFLA